MVTYMTTPWNKLTLGATDLVNVLISAKVTRIENGFDTATIVLPSTSYYPSTVTQGTAVSLAVKDETDTSYTTIFAGIARFVTADDSENSNNLTLNCLGAGYAYGEMLVGSDYGSQSSNGLDTITEIITDSTNGVNDKYVEKILGGSASGYNYDTSLVETISDSIPYINFPYKPANQCFNDLMDLVTAYKAGSAGPHWIVTTDSKLLVKLLTSSVTGWTKYYGNSQANATLTYGVDYTSINLEKMAPEANYIVYYGSWRRPSNGDYWTENNSSLWGIYGTDAAISDEGTQHIVGSYSIKVTQPPLDLLHAHYPSGRNANWNFNNWTDTNTPTINFYIMRGSNDPSYIDVELNTVSGGSITGSFYKEITDQITAADKWFHFTFPIGPYSSKVQTDFKWEESGTANWADIDEINFRVDDVSSDYVYIDGLHFGGAAVCRVAKLSSYSGISVKQRLIVDDVGKDDSLIDGDDTGLMAKLAYSELLRQNTSSTVGTLTTNMIKDLLPGQWLYIQSTDYRATKITHNIVDGQGYTSTIEVTTDVTNGRARTRYEDLNKQFASIRPEWQDRQASNIKAGSVDWQITRLTKSY